MKKIINNIAFFFVGLLLLFYPAVLCADETDGNDTANPAETYELDAIVVTANKLKETISDIPKHVTVISQDDIQASTGKNIVDLLGQESGINIRSTSGSDKQAVIDLRGMGDTAASNVVVMVDDLIINAPDQSGPSIASIPIEQIDRIEVVRGAGSVIYGNGAVGGVINIITKKAGKMPAVHLYSSYGSYKTSDNRIFADTNFKDIFFNINAGVHDTDGYRDNGFFRKKDIGAKSSYAFTDRFSVNLSGMYCEDDYGLPGPVGKSDIRSPTRRKHTDRPDDAGKSSEFRGRAELNLNFEKWGTLDLKRGYLFRDNRYVIGFNPQISRNDQEDRIKEDTRQLDINYVKNYAVGDLPQMLQFGLDDFKTEYIREEKPDGPRKNSETESFGMFVNNRWSLTKQLMVNAGARYNRYTGRFRTDERKRFDDTKFWVNGETTKSEWNNSAYSLGLTYAISPTSSFFTSYATSFRIPNVDEFAESEEGLRPQKGVHIEAGGRRQFGTFLSISISLFDIRIEDEIYYSDINRNYDDKTIRQGIETDVTITPSDSIRLWGNYTFTQAEFAVGNTIIPLVPKHRASAGIRWQMIRQLMLSLSGKYTGSRFDGNDTENDRYDKLDAYMVFDAKLSYEFNDLIVFAGINNILNEFYETSAYSEQYYPMPGRSIYGGIRWQCF